MIRKLQEIGRLAAQEFRNIPDGRKDGPGLAFAAVMQFPEKLLLGIAYGIGTRIEYPVCRNPERGNQRIENLEFVCYIGFFAASLAPLMNLGFPRKFSILIMVRTSIPSFSASDAWDSPCSSRALRMTVPNVLT